MTTHTVEAGAPQALPTLGVVIVNYCTADLTVNCIDSLLAHGIVLPSQIVVVDNRSPDGSGPKIRDARPGVTVVLSSNNGGFGAGVNLGVAALSTDLVLVLNPDTQFRENRIAEVPSLFASEPSLGLLGLKLINPDGTLQYSARRFYSLIDILARRTPLGQLSPLRWIAASHLLRDHWLKGPFESDWVMGTGFVIRRDAFDSVGCMDEGYFLYFEEVDLCARMWIGGWSVMAMPQVELIHEHQRHSKNGIWSSSGRIHAGSMLRFFSKFGIPWVRRPKLQNLEGRYLRWQQRASAKTQLR